MLKNRIEKILQENRKIHSRKARLTRLIDFFVSENTPFMDADYSLHDKPLDDSHILNFNCASFVYLLNSLAASSTFYMLEQTYRHVRYNGSIREQNLLHYPTSVMARFEALSILKNITCSISSLNIIEYYTVKLGLFDDGEQFIKSEIGDPLYGQNLSYPYIPTKYVPEIIDEIETGDTILFLKSKNTGFHPAIIGHVGFAYWSQDRTKASLAHCSKSPLGARGGPLAGVSMLRHWDEETGGLRLDLPTRSILEYLEGNPDLFSGVAIYRQQR